MRFDFTRALGQAEDFLRRHFKPRAVQEAEKRRRQRKTREVGRRLTRAAAVGGTSGAGMVGYTLAVAPMGTAAMVTAGAATLIAAGAALLWPSRPASGGAVSSAELAELAGEAEEWLLRQRDELPGRALPAFDQIFHRLNDLHPRIEEMEPNSTIAWDLRRLLTNHLPRLVHSYAELPASVRESDPELLPSLVEGLATLDEELVRICREASRDHLFTFQAQERFLESRYKDGGKLRGE